MVFIGYFSLFSFAAKKKKSGDIARDDKTSNVATPEIGWKQSSFQQFVKNSALVNKKIRTTGAKFDLHLENVLQKQRYLAPNRFTYHLIDWLSKLISEGSSCTRNGSFNTHKTPAILLHLYWLFFSVILSMLCILLRKAFSALDLD